MFDDKVHFSNSSQKKTILNLCEMEQKTVNARSGIWHLSPYLAAITIALMHSTACSQNQQSKAIPLKFLKHSLHQGTFSIFSCEKYRILHISSYQMHTQTNQKKHPKKQSASVLLLEQRGAALSLSDILHTSPYTSHISHIYVVFSEIFFCPKLFLI